MSVLLNLINPRCEVRVESSVFTTPGDVSPVAEYDVGNLLDLNVNLKQLSLQDNCLLKIIGNVPSCLRKNVKSFKQLHSRRMKLPFMLADFLSIEFLFFYNSLVIIIYLKVLDFD